MLNLIPTGIKLAILAAILTAGGLFYWHYTSVKTERDTVIAKAGALELELAVQDGTIDDLKAAIDKFKQVSDSFLQTVDQLNQTQLEISKNMRELNDVLGKHDLEVLSKAKPGLVERRVNSATNDVLGMFECATGGCKDNTD